MLPRCGGGEVAGPVDSSDPMGGDVAAQRRKTPVPCKERRINLGVFHQSFGPKDLANQLSAETAHDSTDLTTIASAGLGLGELCPRVARRTIQRL